MEHKASKCKPALKFFINFTLGSKKYNIDFKYDQEKDNPQKIAVEMKEVLHLPDDKIEAIRDQIQSLVDRNLFARKRHGKAHKSSKSGLRAQNLSSKPDDVV